MPTTEERVKTIIADQLGVDVGEVTPGAMLMEDLGADSLDIIELTMLIEEEYDIEINDADAQHIVEVGTVEELLKYVAAKVPPCNSE